ncbi:hypothetical protein GCM10009740_24320 [Terrabacter terrae]|uniref:Bulb-type lectin domain-containing protein n=1 Tax=Terrabacter terrae TaxID=318434 RepID=A0ABN2UA71_9MICO
MPIVLRRVLAAAAAVLALGSASALTGPLAGADAATVASPGPILKACYHLKAGTNADRLVNGRFVLRLSSDLLQIEETAWLNGPAGRDSTSTGTWFRDDPNGFHQADHDQTLLAFYCNGDLALRHSDGALLWHSNTANRGATRLALTSGGNLVMTNAAGKVVWQSGSGSVILPANSVLPSNRRLVSAWADQQGAALRSLNMQTDGNLVYRVGTAVRWQTRTTVPGSHAGVTTRGQLVVVAPDGRVLWSSGKTGSSYSALYVSPFWIEQYSPTIATIWWSGVA